MNICPVDYSKFEDRGMPSNHKFTLYDFNIGDEFEIEGLARHDNDVLFSEYCTIFSTVDIITNENGGKPNSVLSCDCSRDYITQRFCRDELARIPIKEGYYYIHAYRKESKSYISSGPTYFIVSEVIGRKECAASILLSGTIIMKVVHKFNNGQRSSMPVKFMNAIDHIMDNMIDNNYYEGSIIPYSINTRKEYDIRLFIRDSVGDFISYRNDGTKYVLHRDSAIHNDRYRIGSAGNVGKFIKISYDKKYSKSNKIIVDGWEMQMLSEVDLNTSLNILIRDHGAYSLDNLKKINTYSGYSFYAMVNYITKEIKAVYNSWGGFPTVALNDKEKSFILNMEEVSASLEK